MKVTEHCMQKFNLMVDADNSASTINIIDCSRNIINDLFISGMVNKSMLQRYLDVCRIYMIKPILFLRNIPDDCIDLINSSDIKYIIIDKRERYDVNDIISFDNISNIIKKIHTKVYVYYNSYKTVGDICGFCMLCSISGIKYVLLGGSNKSIRDNFLDCNLVSKKSLYHANAFGMRIYKFENIINKNIFEYERSGKYVQCQGI